MQLSQEVVKELFDYHEDGYLTWKKLHEKARSIKVGDVAGCFLGNGYKQVRVCGKSYPLHVLIYIYHFGKVDCWVDHRDNICSNNKIENLRPCNQAQNAWNRKTPITSTTGYKGVTKRKNGKYRARLTAHGYRYHLGNFKTAEEAAKAYDAKAKELFGEFALLNFDEKTAPKG